MLPAMNQRTQAAVMGAGALLAGLLLIRFLYLPVLGRIRQQQAAAVELRVKLADAEVLAANLPAQESALQKGKQQADALKAQLREEQMLVQALERLRAQAASLHVQFEAAQAEGPREGRVVALAPGYALQGIPLTVRLVGRYRQIGEFIDRLHEAPFISEVRRLSLTPVTDRSTQIAAELDLAVYVGKNQKAQP